jgi:hypothetical protein
MSLGGEVLVVGLLQLKKDLACHFWHVNEIYIECGVSIVRKVGSYRSALRRGVVGDAQK